LETIRDAAKTTEDKLRLFIIFYLYHDEVSKDELSEYEGALMGAGCDTSVLNYIKQ
jgi:hypothetical protein